jgi:uncharacterized protein (TIGR02679 family)
MRRTIGESSPPQMPPCNDPVNSCSTLKETSDELVEAGLADSLRAALADEQRAGWAAVFAGVSTQSLSSWLASTLNQGLVKRHSGARTQFAAQLLSRVELVLKFLPTNGMTRSQLAAVVLGDAHALDPGRPESSIVLAVLRHARRAGDQEQDIEEDRRETWATAGVLVNELARPALFLTVVTACA